MDKFLFFISILSFNVFAIPVSWNFLKLESGHDPILSPDEKWVIFFKPKQYIVPESCGESVDPGKQALDDMWIYNIRKMKSKLLVSNNLACDHPTKMIIINLSQLQLQFSSNSKIIFFETDAWTTSGAIHSVNVNGKDLRFVTDGNDYHVVLSGKYRGDLIVNQHRYHDQGGSYNWDWLFTPEGKQIKLYKKED